jgi:hypothetical protein
MLFVFDGRQIGAQAVSTRGDFVPGSHHSSVSLTFWADEAQTMVTPNAAFEVWYGGTIGSGTVQSVSWKNE